MAGAGLLEPDGERFALGTDHNGLQVEEIAVIPILIDGLDRQHTFAFIDRDIGGEVSVLDATQGPLSRLGPELAELRPTEPVTRPTRLSIRGECHGPAE